MLNVMRAILFALILTFNLYGLGAAQDRLSYMPDPRFTPGAALNVTEDDLCKSGYKSPDRKIPVNVKIQVFDRYGISANGVGYNVDHLIPASLGGSNSISNLWPQKLSGEWNYHLKNKLERRLHKMVCSGALNLKTAQQDIATDWVSAYKKYMIEPEQTRAN